VVSPENAKQMIESLYNRVQKGEDFAVLGPNALSARRKYGKNKTFLNKNQKNACVGTANMVS
jgi:hypothetical protein